MNGYEFVSKVLSRTRYDVAPLLELASHGEVDWLELKAGTGPKDGVFAPGTAKGDYHRDVAEALYAMANTIGGAVLIGVNETKMPDRPAIPVGLAASGYAGDRDEFLRNLYETVIAAPNGWPTRDRKGRWKCPENPAIFELAFGRLAGEPVGVVLVQPRRPEESYLMWTAELGKDVAARRYMIPVRVHGQTGRIKRFETIQEADSYWRSHVIERPALGELFGQFDAEWSRRAFEAGQEAATDRAVVLGTVGAYVETLKRVLAHAQAEVESFEPDAEEDTGDLVFEEPDVGTRRHARGGSENRRRDARRGSISALVRVETRAVVLGEPGCGKSTLLRRRASELASSWQPGRQWPLLVALAGYGRAGLRALLLQQLPGLALADIHADLSSGRIAMLLDGLDECPSEFLDQCNEEIVDLLENFPAAPMLITSQQTCNPRFLGLPTFSVLPLSQALQARCLATELGDRERATVLLNRLHARPGADFLCSNWSRLSMVANAMRGDGWLPDGNAALFRQSLLHWHEMMREAHIDGRLPSWTFDVARAALARLAFQIVWQGRVAISRQAAVGALSRDAGDDAELLLNYATRSRLMCLEGPCAVRFSHYAVLEYLAAEHIAEYPNDLSEERLGDTSLSRSRAWTMPLVSAFELLAEPPQSLLDAVWNHEPVLLSATIRSDEQLASMPLPRDPWIRGVVQAMRGDNIAEAAREVAYSAHHPPKYPFPRALSGALASSAFWFAAGSHPAGKLRKERLLRLLRDGRHRWFELLPYAYAGYAGLESSLAPPQRLLVCPSDVSATKTDLEDATIPELVALLRRRRIVPRDFGARWLGALRGCEESDREAALVCLLSAEKWLDDDQSVLRGLAQGYREQLRKIGTCTMLSFRVLNLLVRERIISAKEVRQDPDRLADIVERTSGMNAYRFLKNGVLRWDDLTKERKSSVLAQLKPREIRELELAELVPAGTSGAAARAAPYRKVTAGGARPQFSRANLTLPETRQRVDNDIRSRSLDIEVIRVRPEAGIGFAQHRQVEGDIYFRLADVFAGELAPIRKGDTLRAVVAVRRNPRTDEWGFAVLSGELIRRGGRSR